MENKNFADLITRSFLDWQLKAGVRKSIQQYADYLDVPQSSLSNWMAGKYVPKDALNINKLFDKIGPEVFDALELERPLFAREELYQDIRDLAHEIHELPEEYRQPVRNILLDVLHQAIKDTKKYDLLPKPERLSDISDEDLKSAADSIKQVIEKMEGDDEREKTD